MLLVFLVLTVFLALFIMLLAFENKKDIMVGIVDFVSWVFPFPSFLFNYERFYERFAMFSVRADT
jgi:hypothetical protein